MVDPKCPNGGTEPKDVCDCSKAPGWVEGEWADPWCHGGKCFSGQNHDDCVGKENGHQLGDGTWCFDKRRDTECPPISGEKHNWL